MSWSRRNSVSSLVSCNHGDYYFRKLHETIFKNRECCKCKGTGKLDYCSQCSGKGYYNRYCDDELNGVINAEGEHVHETGWIDVMCYKCPGTGIPNDPEDYQKCYNCGGKGKHNLNYNDYSQCKCETEYLPKRMKELHDKDHRLGKFVFCKKCKRYFGKNTEGFKKNKCYWCRKDSNCSIS